MSDRVLVSLDDKMKKTLQRAAEKFTVIRTGRANVEMLSPIKVEYYGAAMAINQLANVAAPEARLLEVRVWDAKAVPAIEKALVASDLGINPSTDGSVIRLKIPPLNEERREELVKKLHVIVEEGRIAIRNVRRDVNEEVKQLAKDKKVTEDERDILLKKVQEKTDKTIVDLEQLAKNKEKEIREV